MSPRKWIEEFIANATSEIYGNSSEGQFRPSTTVNIPLCTISVISLFTNGLLIYLTIAHKCLKPSAYVYMVNWRVLDSCFLLVSQGIRPLIEMVFDPKEHYYFDIYGFMQMFQSSSMLVSILYVHVHRTHFLETNFKCAVVLVWCIALLEAILTIEFISNQTYNKILKTYMLSLFVILLVSTCICQCAYLIFGTHGEDNHRLLLNLTSIYVLFWLPYWSFMFATIVCNRILFEYDVSSLLRCIGFASAPAIFISLLCLDVNFRKYFLKIFGRCFKYRDGRGVIVLQNLDADHNVILNQTT